MTGKFYLLGGTLAARAYLMRRAARLGQQAGLSSLLEGLTA